MSSTVEYVRGSTFHGRHGKVDHKFRYSLDYVLFDAADDTARGPRLFSRNRRNLMTVRDRDHGGARGQGRGAEWVREVLAAHGVSTADGPLRLLTIPRMLGGWFNPVSFWLCEGADGTLRAVIAEVNNTVGERHSYLCAHPDGRAIEPTDTLEAQKVFHVSPFQQIGGGYRFRFDIRPDKLGIWIDFRNGEEGLYATLTGDRAPLTNRAILRSLWRRPVGSYRVLSLIHWHALLLFFKGARFTRFPEPPADEVS